MRLRQRGKRNDQRTAQDGHIRSAHDTGNRTSFALSGSAPAGRALASPPARRRQDEFDRNGQSDINATQALLLFNIGNSELTAGELRSRGYYLGSNVSYNLKKLVEMGFIHHQRSRVDRRSVRVSLTDKGNAIADQVASLYERHISSIEQVGGIQVEEFTAMNKSLQRLDRFWNDSIAYRL